MAAETQDRLVQGEEVRAGPTAATVYVRQKERAGERSVLLINPVGFRDELGP